MTDLVDPTEIERIVGAARHVTLHLGRADTHDERAYVMHSRECVDSGIDLRRCAYSVGLDNGIDTGVWEDYENRPVVVRIVMDRLVPYDLMEDSNDRG